MENNPNKFLQYRKSRFSNLDLLPLYAAVDRGWKTQLGFLYQL